MHNIFMRAIRDPSDCIVLIPIIVLATILAFAGHVIAGRLAGLGITALCSTTMAFFLMPPVFSLRVSQTRDMIALTLYGVAGLVLARTAPPKKRVLSSVEKPCTVSARSHVESDPSRAVEDVMSTDLGIRLRALDFTAASQGFSLPCTRDDARRILSDVLTTAVDTPSVQRVSVYAGQRPGLRRLIVVAHRTCRLRYSRSS